MKTALNLQLSISILSEAGHCRLLIFTLLLSLPYILLIGCFTFSDLN